MFTLLSGEYVETIYSDHYVQSNHKFIKETLLQTRRLDFQRNFTLTSSPPNNHLRMKYQKENSLICDVINGVLRRECPPINLKSNE